MRNLHGNLIISQGSSECLGLSQVEINYIVNEISVTPVEMRSGPKFWQVIAAVQTAGLCHPYTDLLYLIIYLIIRIKPHIQKHT